VKSVQKWDQNVSICVCAYPVVRWVAAATLYINKYGMKHFKSIGHPVTMSFEPGENWKWCYVDGALIA